MEQVDSDQSESKKTSGASLWDFPGWGTAEHIENLNEGPVQIHPLDAAPAHRLGVWKATAICGNDITSSCLYVAALCAIYAGPYAPLALALVALVLYLYRNVYAEVGSALPLNGGAYNVLLNTTSKGKAATAACLTLLSYMATAVLSAYEAMRYAHNLWTGIPVLTATVALLAFFAALNIIGISESANVALILFATHILTLVVLVLVSGQVVIQKPVMLLENWGQPVPEGIGRALFFGFSVALLGISGFESSANFIEEQEESVFPKTLRNMWIAVAVFNPLISLLAMGVLPLSEITAHKEDLLAQLGSVASGPALANWVSLDATLVLSGAVLTSYVGMTGLVRRMSLDRCLPQFLLAQNRWRQTNHWIVLAFFVLCSSILIVSAGDIQVLAGVYTLSFLCVMALFAIGNMLLKMKRSRLPRSVRAGWLSVIAALLAVLAGLLGNLLLHPSYLRVFLTYLAVCTGAVAVMFLRVQILRSILSGSRAAVARVRTGSRWINLRIRAKIQQINSLDVIYFSRGDDLAALNRAAVYVLKNELTTRMKVVHCYQDRNDIPAALAENLRTIDHIYPRIRIDLVLVQGIFCPELIERLSRRLKVPKNYMFIGTPGDRFPHSISDLGGVRLIM
ncbi:MAG: APC family permease [Acidobacteriota bacterium]